MLPVAPRGAIERRRLRVEGVVQGVGFRPFVDRLAHEHEISGFVLNDGHGVLIEAEADAAGLDAFVAALRERAPAPARIDALRAEPIVPRGDDRFSIARSSTAAHGARTLVPADAATCEQCLRELFDPADRRHRYPFVNCTACGPRFTIVTGVPYDRERTTMASFEMCAACRAEYEDPGDRRFHAEPIACPDCGPALELLGAEATPSRSEAALSGALELIRAGAIVAVKGLGGWHLACDAGNEQAVARLRSRKLRDDKPFAVMTSAPEALAELTATELDLLRAPSRPIVLAARRAAASVAPAVAPGSPWLGLMLPYTPLHHLLATDFGGPLVMTSGNRSDEPIATADTDARARLGQIADAFLGHDRAIHRRCEDSVARAAFPVRRSRGLVPVPLAMPLGASRPIVGSGAELKATFTVARGGEAFPSAHLGDLTGELALRAFADDLGLYLEMLGVEPEVIACDLHPDYLSSRWAHEEVRRRVERGAVCELVEVQHHHAHAAACLAEHGRSGPALALVFDGTGLGSDGALWGGELLRFDLSSFERVSHLEPLPLPGGERAIREPWRVAAACLERVGRPVPARWAERWALVRQSLAVNAPPSAGMGRLFDAASALLGVREEVSYEGQAAIELEWLAAETAADPYVCRTEAELIHGSDLIATAYDELLAGRAREEIAAAFHEGVAAAAARACALAAEPRTVVLSGGSFQNMRLLASLRRRLANLGFEVLSHERLPPNDGGISYGQAVVAAARTAGEGE